MSHLLSGAEERFDFGAIDHNISTEGVLEEAKYYGIESLISELEKYRNAAESKPHFSSLNIVDRHRPVVSSKIGKVVTATKMKWRDNALVYYLIG